MLMRHEEHGWNNATDGEIAELKKAGWVEVSDAERKAIIDKKRAEMSNNGEIDYNIFKSGIIDTQRDAPVRGKPGRKPKNFGVTPNEHSPDTRKS